MQCYTELLPPTGVTHSLSLPFLSSTSKNLIVAKTSLLQIFYLKSKSKLVLVAEQHLPGTITALGRVKPITSKSGGEALLVAVRDAKLSLIEWDPERHGITTVSIHYYEGEDMQTNPFAAELSQCRSILTVDPSSRCAALKFGARNLAILPFHQPGDDLVMEDYNADVDGERPEPLSRATNGESMDVETPYASSFVLPFSALDPIIVNPIHLAFLHEYREPTFGILYSQISPASSLLHEQKDILSYSVFTLDLEQRASTTLLSVSRLPNDLYKIIPLPLPVGGALLVGGNELIHVDQGGKTNSVGVNEFARQNSSFSMADQSGLAMKLECCTIEQFGTDNADMLIGLNSGQLAILNFKLDGRSVSGVSVRRVAEENGGSLLRAGTSSSALLGSGFLFFGSEEADSVLLTWSSRAGHLKRTRSYGVQNSLETASQEDDDDEDVDDYEDDLYSGAADGVAQSQSAAASPVNPIADTAFRVADRLPNLGPLGDIAIGRPHSDSEVEQQSQKKVTADLELVVPSGAGEAGGVAILKREIDAVVFSESSLFKADGLWTVSPKSRKASRTANGVSGTKTDYDQFLIVSTSTEAGDGQSIAFRLTETGMEELQGTEFEPEAGLTVDVGTLADSTRVVQALKSEVRSYDNNFGLAQIYPMTDEETGAEPKITMTSFCDPYCLIVRDDGSLLVLEADESGDLDALEQGDAFSSTKWNSGSLYSDRTGTFVSRDESGSIPKNTTLMFVMSDSGALQIFALPQLGSPAYVLETVGFLPPMLSPEYTGRRYASPESISEILVADLGDSAASSPFIIFRTANDDVALYEPFHYLRNEGEQQSFKSLRFLKIPSYHIPKPPPDPVEDSSETSPQNFRRPLKALADVSGFKAVFLPGCSPSFILKTSSSHPRVVNLRGNPALGLSSYNTSSCQNGFTYVDSEGVLRISQLPLDITAWESSWISQKVKLGEQIDSLCYHSSSGLYVLGASQKSGFKLPEDDELHYEWKNEEISLLPQVEQGTIEILTPQNWTVIDRYQLDPTERVLCIKSLTLQIEDSQEWKEFIAVGTGVVRGEDITARGCVYVFEIIDVVPEPGRPETGRSLKMLSKEEVKGSVTAISSIGTEGCLLIAQGQKCMVRGLKEDGNLLPVAFMDMQCYVSVAKELKGTGMCLMGDALKGLWLIGYTEEPYRMTLFGKDNLGLPVITAEFLPDGKQLYIISADDECNLHVLQFDPENPKSLSGQRLLHRSTFHTGHFPSSITLLPRTTVGVEVAASSGDKTDTEAPVANHQVVITYQTGALGLLTPLSESSYRRLSALQMQLWNALDHACGLNPRAYRAAEADGIGGRTVVDGTMLRRWLELGNQRRNDIAGRAGAELWEIRADLEMVGGAGLGYL